LPKYKLKVFSYKHITKETIIEIDAENIQEAESIGIEKVAKNDEFWEEIDTKQINNDYSAEVLEE
jgi:hypothetical protein|tara:strand:- start:575 stop:769 length:195 start_codon:yes stop_codon:yes gene_type:complete